MSTAADYDAVIAKLSPCESFEGIMLPKVFETNRPVAEQVACIRALEMRDDVMLISFPRSGTHWMWEVGSMLLAGKADYQHQTKGHLMLEATEIEKIEALPSPRLLNTHLPVSMLPNQVKEKGIKVIHVYRNVKDVFVSLYFNITDFSGTDELTWDIYEKMFHSDDCMYGSYFNYLKGVDQFIKDNPSVPVFNVSYEDMKEDLVSVTTRLGEFWGINNLTPELGQAVADACGFQKLKAADKHRKQMPLIEQVPLEMRPRMYRKGW